MQVKYHKYISQCHWVCMSWFIVRQFNHIFKYIENVLSHKNKILNDVKHNDTVVCIIHVYLIKYMYRPRFENH